MPLNNLPRQKLREIIAQYGPSLCDDPRRCDGLLRDLCGEHRREIHVLIGALKERVPADLLALQSSVPHEMLMTRLEKRLYDHLGLAEDFARWAVESWALVLGVISSAECKIRIPEPGAPRGKEVSVGTFGKSGVAEPSGRTSVGWYTYPSSYVSELVGRLAPDKVYIEDSLVQGVDGRELLKQGHMSDTVMDSGKLVACAETDSLLACRCADLVKRWLESIPVSRDESQSNYALRLYCVADNTTKARYELGKWQSRKIFDIRPCVFLAVGYREAKLARKWLLEIEEWAESSFDWVKCTKVWKGVFDDNQEARRCLKEAEVRAKRSFNWTRCARTWKEVFDDDGEALRCLKEAEARAKGSYDWRNCAETWKEAFNDYREVLRCLKETGARGKCSSNDWIWCARTWKEGFDDEPEARRCLEEAEVHARDSSDWRWCAETWKKILGEDQEGRSCLEEAEIGAWSSSDWSNCVRTWKEVFGDEREARRCLKKAEARAKGSFNWALCARTWKKVFDDDGEALRCLKEAEARAKGSSGWSRCAKTWKEVFDDAGEALRCLKEAEARAKGSYD